MRTVTTESTQELVEQARGTTGGTRVDTVLRTHDRAIPYLRGSWGPDEADALVAHDGGWHNPVVEEPAARVGIR